MPCLPAELNQWMFRHSLWHRVLLPSSLLKMVLSTVPIVCYTGRGVDLKAALETDVEHLVPRVQQVDVEEAVRLGHGFLVHRLKVGRARENRGAGIIPNSSN